jgi:transposase
MSKQKKSPKKTTKGQEGQRLKSADELQSLAVVNPDAAGLDIGAEEIWSAVSPHHPGETVRCSGTFTPDLEVLIDWLQGYGVTTVVMESTGVYWVPIFEMLEARGIVCYLVNARHIKHVPGRKSDVMDCQWLQKLHTLGLLNGSFRPDAEMRTLRTYLRHRQQLIEHRAPHILHMQKAMQQMNIQLHHVLSDITGVTGMAILRAIVAGERNPKVLASFRQRTCKADEATIIRALTGTWQAEHLFVLEQSLALYDYYTTQIAECDEVVEQQYSTIKPRWDAPEELPVLPPVKKRSRSKNKPPESTRQELFRIAGVDLVAVDGFSDSLAQTVLSEVGTDMSRFPTEKHFCSWLGLAPHNDVSGGKVLRSYTLKTDNRAGQAFRQAAAAVARSDSAFGAFYRRKRGQLGKMQAMVATAHKIARTVYHMLKNKTSYREMGAEVYEAQQREREVAALRRKAAKLGFTVVEPNAVLVA